MNVVIKNDESTKGATRNGIRTLDARVQSEQYETLFVRRFVNVYWTIKFAYESRIRLTSSTGRRLD
jgi:hypothetical protein